MNYLSTAIVIAATWYLSSAQVWYLTYGGQPHQNLPLHERLPVDMGLDGSNISCLVMMYRDANQALNAVCEPVPVWRHLLAESQARVATW